jgi:hypothetical protein
MRPAVPTEAHIHNTAAAQKQGPQAWRAAAWAGVDGRGGACHIVTRTVAGWRRDRTASEREGSSPACGHPAVHRMLHPPRCWGWERYQERCGAGGMNKHVFGDYHSQCRRVGARTEMGVGGGGGGVGWGWGGVVVRGACQYISRNNAPPAGPRSGLRVCQCSAGGRRRHEQRGRGGGRRWDHRGAGGAASSPHRG